MARFYGKVQGNKGEATRLGHATTGLDVVAMSYSGDVRVKLYDAGGRDFVRISVWDHTNCQRGHTIYNGSIADLLNQSQRKTMLTALAVDTLVNA